MFIYSSKSTVKNNHQINLQVEHKIKKGVACIPDAFAL